MDISNASLLDGASSLAEAILMTLRLTKKKKILLAGSLHPEYIATVSTYLSGFDFIVQEVKAGEDGLVDLNLLKQNIDDDVACCAFQSPNFFGLIENIDSLIDIVKTKGIMTVMSTNPLSLAILREPASLGVDIVCGDGQPLGGSISFGGSSFGYLATKKDYLRQIPGRIVGKTTDQDNNPSYCLTLQTREQHIRRETATSNICSNQSLNTIGAAIYLSLVGKEGLIEIANQSFNNTQYLYRRLSELRGVKIPYQPRVFNEFVWEVENTQKLMAELYNKNIIAGYYIGSHFPKHQNGILSCCTEKKSKSEIDNFINTLAQLLHG